MHADDDEGAVELVDVDLALPAASAVHRQGPNPDRAHVLQGHGGWICHPAFQNIEGTIRLERYVLIYSNRIRKVSHPDDEYGAIYPKLSAPPLLRRFDTKYIISGSAVGSVETDLCKFRHAVSAMVIGAGISSAVDDRKGTGPWKHNPSGRSP